MPSAYEGTDIIPCLRSKYIIRQCRISYRTSDISFQIVKIQVIVKLQAAIVETQIAMCYNIIKVRWLDIENCRDRGKD